MNEQENLYQQQCHQQEMEEAQQILNNDPDYIAWLKTLEHKQPKNGGVITTKPKNPLNLILEKIA